MAAVSLKRSSTSKRSGDASKSDSCRRSICEFVGQYMGKLDTESEWQLLLSFIMETVSICPQAFVSSVHHSSGVPNKDHAFLLWIVSSLLRVLPLLEQKSLHVDINGCVGSIFQLTRQRDHPAFCYLLQETISLSSGGGAHLGNTFYECILNCPRNGILDTVKAENLLLQDEECVHEVFSVDLAELVHDCAVSSSVDFPVYLSHFQYLWNKSSGEDERQEQHEAPSSDPLCPWLLEIRNSTHITFLLQASLDILSTFKDDVCQFCPNETPVLFQALSSSLEYGSLDVKVNALVVVKGLVDRRATVSRATLDHITWCLIALISWVSSAHITGGKQECVPVQLEQHLSLCLRVLFSPGKEEPQAVLRFWEHMLDVLHDNLLLGAYPHCTVELQELIGELVLKCCTLKSSKSVKGEAIVQNIGRSHNLQPLVPVLCYLVMLELSEMKRCMVCSNLSSKSSFALLRPEIEKENGSVLETAEQGKESEKERSEDPQKSRVDGGRKQFSRKLTKTTKLTAEKATVQPSLGPLAMAVCQRSLQCARLVTAICSSDTAGEQKEKYHELRTHLEAMRIVLEVFARISLSPVNPFASHWLNREQLSILCKAWEGTLLMLVQAGKDHQNLNEVLACILDSAGALMLSGGLVSIPSAVLDRCLWLIGLPWSQGVKVGVTSAPVEGLVAGSTLTVQECQMVKDAVAQVGSEGCSSRACSLHALAVLPNHIGSASALITTVYQQVFAQSSSDVHQAAVKTLATALMFMDEKIAPDLISAFCELKPQDVQVQLAFVQELPSILLAASTVEKPRKFNFQNFSVPLHYTCKLAVKALKESSTVARVTLDNEVLSTLLGKVTEITSPEVITELVESFATVIPFVDAPSTIHSKCLALFTHGSMKVRNAVCKHIGLFFPDPNPPLGVLELERHPVIARLKEAFREGEQSGDTRQQEFTISAYGQIGRFAGGNLLLTCVISLLRIALKPSLVLKASAHMQMQSVAASHGLTPTKLLSSLKDAICQVYFNVERGHVVVLYFSTHCYIKSQFLVELLHKKKELAVTPDMKLNVFRQVATTFDVKDLKQFFETIREVFVPLLVCQATPETSEALKFCAQTLDMTPRTLLVDCFKHLFLYLVQNGQQEDLNTASRFLKEEANFEVSTLLRSDCKNILNLLLLHLSTHHNRVLVGVKMLAEMNQTATEQKVLLNQGTNEEIAEYLEPHLHGVMAFFNFVLVRLDYFENSAKGKLAIGSLIELMRLMGPRYITQVKMKVLAMLRHCLTFKDEDMTKLTLSAWNCFVQSVDLDSLGPLLGQIVVALSPLVEEHAGSVAEIFDFLIVEHRTIFAQYFNEIYSMPDAIVLTNVNTVLKDHSTAPRSLHEQVRHVLKGIVHERSDVRLHALRALHKLLTSNRDELQKYMVGSDTVDPIIMEIVTTILRGLRGSSVELREEYGRCLGELGAIDPGKLDVPTASPSKVVKFSEVNGEFAVDLFGELARAYLASTNTRSQDCCAFAIQEVLRIFECANSDPDSEGAKIWSRISVDCQEVLRPHLSSSYSATIPKLVKSTVPIFKAARNVTFHDWIGKWCTFLIHKLKDSLAKTVFLPCSLIFQHDRNLALYLMQHVLTCVLRQATPELMEQVKKEVMTVLHHSARSRDSLPENADSANMCAQTIFTALDYLTSWVNEKWKSVAARRGKGQAQKSSVEEVEKMVNFLIGIPKDVLAQSAFCCRSYTRALMYLELYLMISPDAVQKNLGFLQKIYVALDEPDGVAGVAAVRTTEAALNEQILQYESTGNYRDAAACYERAIQLEPDDIGHHENMELQNQCLVYIISHLDEFTPSSLTLLSTRLRCLLLVNLPAVDICQLERTEVGLLRCMMRQGEFTSAQMHVDGLQMKRVNWMQRLNAFRVEAAWKLGRWDDLGKYLKMEPVTSKNWDVNLGRLLLAAKQKDLRQFITRVNKVRTEQMGPLSAASLEQGSYQRGYEYIVRLHMVQELEEGMKNLMNTELQRVEPSIQNSWEARFELTQESFRTQESILSLRRVILGLQSGREKQIGQYWLKSARIARRAGHLQAAQSFLLNGRNYCPQEYCMENAEHMKAKGASHEALLSLQKAVSEQWPAEIIINLDGTGDSATRNIAHSEALLLIARWMEDTAHYDTQTVLRQYKYVISVHPESEDGHFYLGKYYDRLMTVLASDRPTKSAEFLQFILRHYGHALQHGNKYIYQCMPRMLSLWLDFGSNVPDTGKRTQERVALKDTINTLNAQMKTIMERLPPYQFLIAFSQLISRICHPNSDVFAQLEVIILKLLEHYPQQSLWMMIAVSKSTHPDRQQRCQRIIDTAKRRLPYLGKLIDDMVKLSDKLLEVCNKHVEVAKSHSMDKLCRGLTRLTSSSDFSCIMVPLQSSLTVTLPVGHGTSTDHNPFPGIQPAIVKFEDKVEVLASLQKPKKVTVTANDGNSYIFLCKPKDDLRKDARLMEFNSLVNKCLRKDQECRQRRLYIRTYAVIPLNEECGILEWVPNTHGLRNILHKLYQEKGMYVTGRELRDIIKPAQSDALRLKEIFLKQLLPRHPPVFAEWFMRTFPDPTAWYSSRLSYAHTAAVVSMVGYILGLGDRHGENILFDSTSGDCIHVDFNCLFNRGETFDVPEVVPFRMTHNMVHGLGVTGTEGVFRKSCEATLKVLRQECDALMCVLKTFIHDPLVEWEKVKGRGSLAETSNEKALKIVRDIEERLQGKFPKSRGLPLSIEGQVHSLIKDATDVNNLSRMYIGWAAFL